MPRKERVTRVIDGDTFETASRKHPVRLAGVDTPDKREPGYGEAKRALERAILGQEVVIDTKARDKHGRSVADVRVGRESVNKMMKQYKK